MEKTIKNKEQLRKWVLKEVISSVVSLHIERNEGNEEGTLYHYNLGRYGVMVDLAKALGMNEKRLSDMAHEYAKLRLGK